MTRLRGAGCCMCLCVLFTVRAGNFPEKDTIQAQIHKLGAEEFEEREAAQKQLRDWSERFPRGMLIALGEVYRAETDPERLYRLRGLLRELAAEELFYRPYGFIGIQYQLFPSSDEEPVVDVTDIIPGEAAERAGLRAGDRILALNGVSIREIETTTGFAEWIRDLAPGEEVEFLIERAGSRLRVDLQMGMRVPDERDWQSYQSEQEQRTEDWLRSLREPAHDPDKPVGQFRVGE